MIYVMSFLFFISTSFSLTGTVYDFKDRKKILFTYEKNTVTTKNGRVDKAAYKYPNGKVALTEEIEYQKGAFKSYTIVQQQTKSQGRIEINDSLVRFFYTSNGKEKKDQEKYVNNFVIPQTMGSYLKTKWSKILNGDKVKVRLAVLDRLETVGFSFSLQEKIKKEGETLVRLKMQPTSFIIAALVDPLYLTFSEDGEKLRDLLGRVTPKKKVDNQFVNLEAYLVFDE